MTAACTTQNGCGNGPGDLQSFLAQAPLSYSEYGNKEYVPKDSGGLSSTERPDAETPEDGLVATKIPLFCPVLTVFTFFSYVADITRTAAFIRSSE